MMFDRAIRVESQKEQMAAPASEPGEKAISGTGVDASGTMLGRLLVILSRYREASIAVVAVVLVVYFQIGSAGGFLTSPVSECGLAGHQSPGLDRVAEVLLMITGEIDLSLSSTFSVAPYMNGLDVHCWGVRSGSVHWSESRSAS